MTNGKIRRVGFLRKPVPRADQLTVIAAVNAVTHQRAQRLGDVALVLDGQVGNAASRIQLVWGNDGLRRADVDAARAGAAVRGLRDIHRKRQIGINFAEEKPGTGFAIKHQRVLAAPAQSGFHRQFHFHDRGAVGEYPMTKIRYLCNAVTKLLQPPAQHLVIVAPKRITRHVRAAAIVHDLPGVRRFGRKIIHPHRNDPQRAWHQFRRSCAPRAVSRQIVHVALPAARQPLRQAAFGFAQIAIGNTHLLKAEFQRPVPDAGGQCGTGRLICKRTGLSGWRFSGWRHLRWHSSGNRVCAFRHAA